MKRTFKNSSNEIWENERGDRVGICANECFMDKRGFVHVIVKRATDKRGKTVKTRCTYDTALQIAREILD